MSNLITIGEGPAGFQLIKSGWEDKGRYHLIYENPEEGDFFYEHYFITEDQIRNKFPYAISKMEELKND